jgi:hypothetical protein
MDLRRALDSASKGVHGTYDRSMDVLLERLGLEQKRSNVDALVPALGIFGAGLAVGAVLGLLFAPKRGEDLRGDIRHRVTDARDVSTQKFTELKDRGRTLMAREAGAEDDEDASA